MNNNSEISFLVNKLSLQKEYIAYYLHHYEVDGIEASRQQLGCTTESLLKLLTCRVPDFNQADFINKVQRIAEYAEVNSDKLCVLLRSVNVKEKFRNNLQHGAPSSFAMAAREKTDQKIDDDQ